MDSSAPTTETPWLSSASDLSKLCLPQEYKDSNRQLAWVNSICCLFLFIGAVGFSPPKVYVRSLSEVTEVIPVIIVPPEDTPKPPPTEQPNDPEPSAEATLDAPVLATVVAADASTAVFAVPVEGPVVLAPTRFAPPPPAAPPRPRPTGDPSKYVPSVGDWGGHPAPDYPGLAIRMGYQGTVTLQITVDAEGNVSDVQVKKSSGFKILDDSALDHVRKHLRLRNPPGEMRYHTLDIVFKLQR